MLLLRYMQFIKATLNHIITKCAHTNRKVKRTNFTFSSHCLHYTTRGHTNCVSCIETSNHRVTAVDEVGPASSRPPAEAHLDILHAQDVPAVVHVLLEVFVLDKREREKEKERALGYRHGNSCAPVF